MLKLHCRKLLRSSSLNTNNCRFYPHRNFFGKFNGSYVDNKGHEIVIDSKDKKLCFSINNSFAPLAESSVLTKYGNTVVHVSVCSNKCDEPSPNMVALNVDYRSRAYAFGRLVDSKQKRERHNTDDEILAGRIIDRSIRPLFPKGYLDEIQLTCTSHSVDGIHDPIVTAVNGASMALIKSKQPWNGPIGCARIGMIDGQLVLNPSAKDMEKSTLDLIYSGTSYRTLMMEISGHEIEEDSIKAAMKLAHSAVQDVIELQNSAITPKDELSQARELPIDIQELFRDKNFAVKDFSKDILNKIINVPDDMKALGMEIGYDTALQIFCKGLPRSDRSKCEAIVRSNIMTKLSEKVPTISPMIRSLTAEYVMSKAFRDTCLNHNSRVDGREITELRDINFDCNLLPQAHGSSFFERGETRVLCSTTIGSIFEEKKFFPINGAPEKSENFFLHYDFPPYCTGEVGNATSLNRRMVGHGNLAEKAVKAVIPSASEFPYTIRVFSECTSSNGSSSMASACGASLALVDAGVPIKSHVAGLSIGLVTTDEIRNISDDEKDVNYKIPKSQYTLLTDILGSEDHYGDMDFKVAGTKNGITAVQLDVKLTNGIPISILEEALERAMEGRKSIIAQMDKYSPFQTQNLVLKNNVPRAAMIKYEPSRYKYLVGPGGEMIKFIEETYKCSVQFREEGVVYVYGENEVEVDEACLFIKELVCNINENDVFHGQVVEVKDYGALVKITRAQIALLHISELTHDPELLKKPVSELVAVGQRLQVKVLNVDKGTGQIKVSRRQLLNLSSSEKDPLIFQVPTADTPQMGIIPTFPTTPPRAWSREYFKTNVASEADIEKVMKTKEIVNKKNVKPRDSTDSNQISTNNQSSSSPSPQLETSNGEIEIKESIRKSVDDATKVWRERGKKPKIEKQSNENATDLTADENNDSDSRSDRNRSSNNRGGKDRPDRGEKGDRSDRGERSKRGDRSDRGDRSKRGDRSDRGERSQKRTMNSNNDENEKEAQPGIDNDNETNESHKNRRSNRRRPIKAILDELIDITDSSATSKSNSDEELIGNGYRGLFTKND